MAGLVFSPAARDDLVAIGDHIARDSPISARAFVARLRNQCERILLAPLGYVAREDLAPGLRLAALDRYVILFRILDDTVRVERVLHGARHLPGLFGIPGDDFD